MHKVSELKSVILCDFPREDPRHHTLAGFSRVSDMEALVNGSNGWTEQLAQLNTILTCLASANEMERTGVGVGDSKKRSRFPDHAGEHLVASKSVSGDALHDILQNIANLVCLVEAENEFVRHAVKKILVALSDHLILTAQMSSWCSLIHHIWDVLSQDCGKGLMAENDVNKEKDASASVNQPIDPEVKDSLHLKKSWGAVVCGLEILRCILKSCLDENVPVDEHIEVFLGLVAEKIYNVVKMVCPETGDQGDSFCSERGLAWGALLQLLCTAIACCDQEAEDSPSASSELQLILIEKIGSCIPLFSEIALSPHKHSPSVHCPSSFLRHKVLQLMIGLSKWFEVEQNLALQCLRALRNEAADLIGFSLLENGTFSRENNFMRSSFLTSFVHSQVSDSLPRSATHLRCRALFLLFRISSLVAKEFDPNQAIELNNFKRNNPEDRKELEDRAPLVSAEIHQHGRNCSNISGTCNGDAGRGVTSGIIQTSCQCENSPEEYLKQETRAAVQEWLLLQSDAVTNETLEDFSMTFVGLYLDEDDLMIETLLLLTKLRSSLLALEDRNLKRTLTIATALGPAQLFQAFLRSLSYDHTVLVDFLISQNTGTLFLRYLMLCTGLFVKPEFHRKTETSSLGLAKECLNCLSQLKAAIERLHRRKLFPYNPSSLLKRLVLLEELHHRK